MRSGLAENIAKFPRVREWQSRGPKGGPHTWWPNIYTRDDQEMARRLVKGWMDSPGHRANIMNPGSRRIGVGVAIHETLKHGYIDETVYATQNFSGCS